MEDDYMMLDADHLLRIKPVRNGEGYEGDVVMLPVKRSGKQGMTATHLFDVPAEPNLDLLRESAQQALKALREG
jgi:hypothetical protein